MFRTSTRAVVVSCALLGAAVMAAPASAQSGRAPAGSSLSGESTMRTEPIDKSNPTVRNQHGISKMMKSFGSKKKQRGASKAAPL
ncbi:hypothetical protein ABEG18_04805 [Alsobacter sp. KACC 23698]|uniref:Phosphate starvation-inducible protein PsiF n=1 Tax=Alsobacter sp. KACC 23698 TaxID=3149229 RepID=A0AAU7JJE8_9HYPH